MARCRERPASRVAWVRRLHGGELATEVLRPPAGTGEGKGLGEVEGQGQGPPVVAVLGANAALQKTLVFMQGWRRDAARCVCV